MSARPRTSHYERVNRRHPLPAARLEELERKVERRARLRLIAERAVTFAGGCIHPEEHRARRLLVSYSGPVTIPFCPDRAGMARAVASPSTLTSQFRQDIVHASFLGVPTTEMRKWSTGYTVGEKWRATRFVEINACMLCEEYLPIFPDPYETSRADDPAEVRAAELDQPDAVARMSIRETDGYCRASCGLDALVDGDEYADFVELKAGWLLYQIIATPTETL